MLKAFVRWHSAPGTSDSGNEVKGSVNQRPRFEMIKIDDGKAFRGS